MEDKLTQIPEQDSNQITYENFDTDEPQTTQRRTLSYSPIIFASLFVLLFILIIFYLTPSQKLSFELSHQTQCLTSSENKKECKSCNTGDK